MFGNPATSDLDLRFRVFAVPVRVTPWFWLVTVLLSPPSLHMQARWLILWVVCVFVSILCHEMGHAMMARLFGCWPSITLQNMGGYCDTQGERLTPWRLLAVIAAGPAMGFLVYALLIAGLIFLNPNLSEVGERAVSFLLMINLWWSIFNLLPVIPLDGGQGLSVILQMVSPRSGARWAVVVSLITAGLGCAYFFSGQNWFMALLFASFGVMNYMELQSIYQTAKSGYDDADWWRR
jgi:stage IV sporulation protein FB